MALEFRNYTLGRGRILFSLFSPNTQIPAGHRYLGNTPGFTLTADIDNLDHYSSDEGIKEKDDGVTLQVNRTATINCDNINRENLSLFLFGSVSRIATTAATAKTYDTPPVSEQFSYQLGATLLNPTGDRAIDVTPVTGSTDAGTTYDLVENVDFKVNRETGLIDLLEAVNYDEGDIIKFKYDTRASTYDRVLSGTQQLEGALRYEANNPKGSNNDLIMPYVTITPNGDLDFKSDDWQVIPFTVQINRPRNGGASVIIDGRPVFA